MTEYQPPRVEGARTDAMRERHESEIAAKKCAFCLAINGDHSLHKSAIFLEGEHWVATYNDFPYEGLSHHVLILPRNHVNDMADMIKEELEEFGAFMLEVALSLRLTGWCLHSRVGDPRLTAQTSPHLSVHVTQSNGLPVDVGTVSPEIVQIYDNLLERAPEPERRFDWIDEVRIGIDALRAADLGKAFPVRAKLSNEIVS